MRGVRELDEHDGEGVGWDGMDLLLGCDQVQARLILYPEFLNPSRVSITTH